MYIVNNYKIFQRQIFIVNAFLWVIVFFNTDEERSLPEGRKITPASPNNNVRVSLNLNFQASCSFFCFQYAWSVYLYHYNRSQILRYVKYTK